MAGKLVVFEGLDGAGKSRTVREFEVKLWENGITNTYLTNEPFNQAAAGDFIRASLQGAFKPSPYLLAQALSVNRMAHLEGWILPALAEGKIVICDRYLLSSLVYNVTTNARRSTYQVGIDLSVEDVQKMNERARKPDVTFFLHASVETCLERIRERGKPTELYEQSLPEMMARYLMRIDDARRAGQVVHMIDADDPFENVLMQVMAFWKQH